MRGNYHLSPPASELNGVGRCFMTEVIKGHVSANLARTVLELGVSPVIACGNGAMC